MNKKLTIAIIALLFLPVFGPLIPTEALIALHVQHEATPHHSSDHSHHKALPHETHRDHFVFLNMVNYLEDHIHMDSQLVSSNRVVAPAPKNYKGKTLYNRNLQANFLLTSNLSNQMLNYKIFHNLTPPIYITTQSFLI